MNLYMIKLLEHLEKTLSHKPYIHKKKCDHLQLKFYSPEKSSLTRYSNFRLDLPVILSLALLLLSFVEIMYLLNYVFIYLIPLPFPNCQLHEGKNRIYFIHYFPLLLSLCMH